MSYNSANIYYMTTGIFLSAPSYSWRRYFEWSRADMLYKKEYELGEGEYGYRLSPLL